jgi:glyoxylase-like metal-dependent hydrolase (beta-lactamase superfamily II)
MFLGTRGEIEKQTRRHRMHTSLMGSYRRANVMIDCGLDWLGKFERLRPSAIVLTHAHPDHAWGLKRSAPCPVYAPQKTWQELQHYRSQVVTSETSGHSQKFVGSHSKRSQSNILFFPRPSDIA